MKLVADGGGSYVRPGLGLRPVIDRSLHIVRPHGIVLGASGSVMLRELVLFRADVTRTAWFRRGDAPPRPDLPDTVALRWLSADEWRSNPAILERDAAEIGERYENGSRCLIGADTATGRIIYHLWISVTGIYTDWIFDVVDPLPRHLLVHDVWLHPEHRGGNIHWVGASMACAEVVRRGHVGIVAGVEEHEYFLFAVKYARIGLVLAMPYTSVVGLKIGGLRLHFRRTPSRKVMAFSRRLTRRHPDICLDGDDATAYTDADPERGKDHHGGRLSSGARDG